MIERLADGLTVQEGIGATGVLAVLEWMRQDGARIRTMFLVWSPVKRTRSKERELPCFPLTEMNDHDGTAGRRKTREDTSQDT
jgi:hypothetical protein